MDNNTMFKPIESEIKVLSEKENQYYTLKELLTRIEDLEDKQMDIRYFLANPSKLNY